MKRIDEDDIPRQLRHGIIRGEPLGEQGGCAQVFHANTLETHLRRTAQKQKKEQEGENNMEMDIEPSEFVLKIVNGPQSILQAQHEARILEHLSKNPDYHKYFVHLITHYSFEQYCRASVSLIRYHCLILENVELGSLSSLLLNCVLTERQRKVIARDLAKAIAILHAEHVLHLDLKPANVLITKDGRAKLCDFGLSVKGEIITYKKNNEGTLAYWPPEQLEIFEEDVFTRRLKFSRRSDIWAFGLILYQLYTGDVHFPSCYAQAESRGGQPYELFLASESLCEQSINKRDKNYDRFPPDLLDVFNHIFCPFSYEMDYMFRKLSFFN